MSYVVGLPKNEYKPIAKTTWVRAGFVNYKKGVLDSQPQVIKITSCLVMVDDCLRVLRLVSPLKLVVIILLKVALSTKDQIKSTKHVVVYCLILQSTCLSETLYLKAYSYSKRRNSSTQ